MALQNIVIRFRLSSHRTSFPLEVEVTSPALRSSERWREQEG